MVGLLIPFRGVELGIARRLRLLRRALGVVGGSIILDTLELSLVLFERICEIIEASASYKPVKPSPKTRKTGFKERVCHSACTTPTFLFSMRTETG